MLKTVDPIWDRLRSEAEEAAQREPQLAGFLHAAILHHETLESSVAHRIASRLEHAELGDGAIRQAFEDAIASDPEIGLSIRADLAAVLDRDPVAERYLEPVLYFKGFHALEAQRFANRLWKSGRKDIALYLQSAVSAALQVDIHPAVPIGKGVFIDHGTGVIIGATAVIEDDVSILQNVTLGGTGKEQGDRHPKIRHGVLIGAGAKILGNIEIGAGSRVAAGSVVLKSVPACTTVAGVPARVVGRAPCADPSRSMDHMLSEAEIFDPVI
ncbi:serine O-acetyltransferase [Terrihabitans soli]|uniref:Serine acetyltransferase n=1 Tax=Terrihabitans soli TaxID=708113 RepID=A0A6S6QLK9_9HYPH|nr:serine O-acetyltransferase [Terrihabitans soli]